MKIIVRYFQEFLLALKLSINSLADKMLYIDALSSAAEESAQGFFLLGDIYEKGNSFISRDMALAYVMYYLSAQKQMKVADDKASQLRLRLTSRDWMKINRTLKKFSQ